MSRTRFRPVDLTYMEWHREASVGRYLSRAGAWALGLIDIDGAEWCRSCGEPLALTETARFNGLYLKNTSVTQRVGVRADLPVYLVFYEADDPTPCDRCGGPTTPLPDITAFHVVGPMPVPISSRPTLALHLTPGAYAAWLLGLRTAHRDSCEKAWGREWSLMVAS